MPDRIVRAEAHKLGVPQFSALVLMVTVTTVLGLLLLERRLSSTEATPA
jgi:hypothetical protein